MVKKRKKASGGGAGPVRTTQTPVLVTRKTTTSRNLINLDRIAPRQKQRLRPKSGRRPPSKTGGDEEPATQQPAPPRPTLVEQTVRIRKNYRHFPKVSTWPALLIKSLFSLDPPPLSRPSSPASRTSTPSLSPPARSRDSSLAVSFSTGRKTEKSTV